MSAVFCCSSISPYRPRQLDHEAKFKTFTSWAGLQETSVVLADSSLMSTAPYAVQVVKQVNYGPQESIRYFIPSSNGSGFAEAKEDDLLASNFEKMNSYKNFRCQKHNLFFEINLYQKNPTNTHHWRVNLARPSRDIDLALRRKDTEAESSNKGEELMGQKEEQDLLSPGVKGKSSSPEPRVSLSQALRETDEAVQHNLQSADQPDIRTLKKVLRFLLPMVETNLGQNRLLTLLFLHWVNAELELGHDFESLWKAELTSTEIILFISDCVVSCATSTDFKIDLAEVEGVVVPAMRHVESRNGKHLAGQAKFQEIVNRALESGSTLDWVSMYGSAIKRLFESDPGELLDHYQRSIDRLQSDSIDRQAEEADDTESEKIGKEFLPWGHRGNDEEYDFDYNDHGFDSDHGSMKDLTACDKECGYCGHCDY